MEAQIPKDLALSEQMNRDKQTARVLETLKQIGLYFVILLVTVIFVFPYFWMVISAFKSRADIIAIPPKIFYQNLQSLYQSFF